MAKKTGKKTGRPTELTDFKLEKTDELVSKGMNNTELAKILGVSTTTIKNWRSNSEEFLATYQLAKLKAKEAVEGALFNRAVGYTYEKETITIDSKGEQRTVIDTVVVVPDVTAQQFFLKNKDPENFKDKSEQHITGQLDHKNTTETPEQQLERVKAMLKDEK